MIEFFDYAYSDPVVLNIFQLKKQLQIDFSLLISDTNEAVAKPMQNLIEDKKSSLSKLLSIVIKYSNKQVNEDTKSKCEAKLSQLVLEFSKYSKIQGEFDKIFKKGYENRSTHGSFRAYDNPEVSDESVIKAPVKTNALRFSSVQMKDPAIVQPISPPKTNANVANLSEMPSARIVSNPIINSTPEEKMFKPKEPEYPNIMNGLRMNVYDFHCQLCRDEGPMVDFLLPCSCCLSTNCLTESALTGQCVNCHMPVPNDKLELLRAYFLD